MAPGSLATHQARDACEVTAAAAGDLDADGDPDFVASGGFSSGAIRFFENTGSALALKLVERTGGANPFAGLQNNTFGTLVVAETAKEFGVERFVLVSSDKAVRPTNVMGASKRLAEQILQALAQGHHFGFDVMDATGLPSGTVYPALRRLKAMGLVESSWEEDAKARRSNRPRRRNYRLTRLGREQLAGLLDALFAAVHLAGEQKRLRLGARRREPALHQEHIHAALTVRH